MLTRKNRHGLQALADIATLDPGKSPSLAELAERHAVSTAELEILFGALIRHGILQKKPERAPGYFLSKPASEIKIGHVLRALYHPIGSLECQNSSMSRLCNDCLAPQSCGLRLSIAEVCDTITTLLDQTSLADLIPQSAEFASTHPDKNAAPYHLDA